MTCYLNQNTFLGYKSITFSNTLKFLLAGAGNGSNTMSFQVPAECRCHFIYITMLAKVPKINICKPHFQFFLYMSLLLWAQKKYLIFSEDFICSGWYYRGRKTQVMRYYIINHLKEYHKANQIVLKPPRVPEKNTC